MSQPTSQPSLTPQVCFSTTALRGMLSYLWCLLPPSFLVLTRAPDFLRLSRSTIDDSIAQNLNALVTPARAGFDPSSTSQRTPGPLSSPSSARQIDPRACQAFREQVLFPSWQARADLLSYCALVATSPDPDDPEAAIREAELERDRERLVNERLDPYSARFFPREPRTEQLAALLRQENGVENIVRARTWGLVRERCGGEPEGWEQALQAWRRRRDGM